MAVKNRAQLNAQAIVIRDETVVDANTALRVGGLMTDETDSYAMLTDIPSLTGQPASNIASGTFDDARISQSSVTQHEGALTLSASQTTSGTFADAQISQSSVTQHQAALAITASQVSDFDTEVSNNTDVAANTAKVSWTKPCEIMISSSDLTTDLTTGTTKAYIRMPYAMTLTDVRASVLTAPTGSVLTVDINESGATILSTKITIDISEKTSVTAATPPVISDSSLADDAEITIDIDTIGSSVAGAGLIVTLIGTRT